MMRVKDLPKEKDPEERQLVADFFGVPVDDVTIEPQPHAFTVDLNESEFGQQQYKKCNKYGNVKGCPGIYNFSHRLLVVWNGTKVQPA